MCKHKNIVMIVFSSIVIELVLVVFLLHRVLEWIEPYALIEQSLGAALSPMNAVIIGVMLLTSLTLIIVLYLLFRKNHSLDQQINTVQI